MPAGPAAAFAALSFIWGSTYLFIKVGLRYWPPFWFAAARNAVACVALLALMLALHRQLPRRWRDWWPPMVFAFLNSISFALIFWGQRYIPSAQSAVLVAAMPLFTLPLARLWGREAVGRSQVAGVALGFVGVLLAAGLREGAGFTGPLELRLWAQLGMVGAAFCYASSYVFSRRYFTTDPYSSTAIHLGMSAVYLAALAGAVREVPGPQMAGLPALTALAYLAVVGSALAYWLMFYLVEHIGSVRASYVTLINPVVAVLLGVVVLGEPLTARMAAGAGLVVGGAWLVSRRPAPVAPQPLPAAKSP